MRIGPAKVRVRYGVDPAPPGGHRAVSPPRPAPGDKKRPGRTKEGAAGQGKGGVCKTHNIEGARLFHVASVVRPVRSRAALALYQWESYWG
jgi:hypothetical protein